MSKASLPEELQELLGAFADGQLAGAEKQRAQKLVAEDARCAEFVEQIRSQSRRFRELPKYRLSSDFSQRVLDRFHDQAPALNARNSPKPDFSNSKPGNFPEHQFDVFNDWRVGAGALMGLAAMLMLALFFGPAKSANESDIAKVENDTPTEMIVDKNEVRTDSSEMPLDDLGFGDVQIAKVDPKLERANLARETMENSPTIQDELEESADGIDPSLLNPGVQALASQSGAPGSELTTPIQTSDQVPGVEQIANIQSPQNIDEVWMIDLKGEEPLERLKLALAKNRIEFQISEAPSRPGASIPFQAMHVSTTKSQIRGAMALLTDEADILSYHIPAAAEWSQESQVAGAAAPVEAEPPTVDKATPPKTGLRSRAVQLAQVLDLPRGLDYTEKLNSLIFEQEQAEPAVVEPEPEKQLAEPEVAEAASGEDSAKPWYEVEAEKRAKQLAEKARQEERLQNRISEPVDQKEEMKKYLLLIRFAEWEDFDDQSNDDIGVEE